MCGAPVEGVRVRVGQDAQDRRRGVPQGDRGGVCAAQRSEVEGAQGPAGRVDGVVAWTVTHVVGVQGAAQADADALEVGLLAGPYPAEGRGACLRRERGEIGAFRRVQHLHQVTHGPGVRHPLGVHAHRASRHADQDEPLAVREGEVQRRVGAGQGRASVRAAALRTRLAGEPEIPRRGRQTGAEEPTQGDVCSQVQAAVRVPHEGGCPGPLVRVESGVVQCGLRFSAPRGPEQPQGRAAVPGARCHRGRGIGVEVRPRRDVRCRGHADPVVLTPPTGP